MNWQPIESVPEDIVVLLCDANGNRWTDVGRGEPANSCGFPPTHWMPLPEPPK
jgi:hypothetical protein